MCKQITHCVLQRWVLFVLLFGTLSGCAQNPLDEILGNAGPLVSGVCALAEEYQVQCIYVQIDRDAQNVPHFKSYSYRVDPRRYFYPASTVKFPVAVLALEKLHELNIPGLDIHSRMRIDSARSPQSAMLFDSTSATGLPSVGHFVHQVFLVSDNNAHNRLYEFLGQEEIHSGLAKRGLPATRILHRLSAPQFTPLENRYSNPVMFYHGDTLVYQQSMQFAPEYHDPLSLTHQYQGVGYISTDNALVNEPFDFSKRNFFPLHEQIKMLKAVLFHQHYPEAEQFCPKPEDYPFLHRAMGMLPRESRFPVYDTTAYPDGYVKFFLYGGTNERIPGHIRIFNKVGWAYGFMTDCAYIVDFEKGVEFILAATICVNKNGIFNDGVYAYDSVGLPFFADLGKAVYHYELNRNRTHPPDLSYFQKLFD